MGIPRFAVSSFSTWLAIAAICAQVPATAQDVEPLDEVVVSGEYPGPGLWKITRADDAAGHVMWIVGEPPPLPKRMKWKSKDIEAVALGAQEILRDSAVRMDADEKIGFFRGITLLPAILEARRNPDDAKLKDLVPAEMYARWLVQKKRYLGRETGVESWRPLFAADKLRKAAFDDLKLREGGTVWEVIGKLAEKHKIKVTTPLLRYTFKRSEVRHQAQGVLARVAARMWSAFGTCRGPHEGARRPRDPGCPRARLGHRRSRSAGAVSPLLPVPIYPAPWPC
jgi:hypothetical protein